MKKPDSISSSFQLAVSAIDAGNIAELEDLITSDPGLVRDRLRNNENGYFKDPYLLWFVADNPIRVDKLPANIIEITNLLIQAVKRESPDTCQQQIDYTLALVASGYIPRECGVQIPMIDLLIDAGASPDVAMIALTNGNLNAAQHLIDHGSKLNLALAVCLEHMDDIGHLAAHASDTEKLTALAAAAYYGKANMIKRLLEMGTDPDGYPAVTSGFHSHATPLHQAVSSGSLDSVKLLVEAGARRDMPDKIYDGTPMGWAIYLQSEHSSDEAKQKGFALIETYLRDLELAN